MTVYGLLDGCVGFAVEGLPVEPVPGQIVLIETVLGVKLGPVNHPYLLYPVYLLETLDYSPVLVPASPPPHRLVEPVEDVFTHITRLFKADFLEKRGVGTEPEKYEYEETDNEYGPQIKVEPLRESHGLPESFEWIRSPKRRKNAKVFQAYLVQLRWSVMRKLKMCFHR